MATWKSRWWRLANRLQAIYAADAGGDDGGVLPEEDWRELRRLAARRAAARFRGWRSAEVRARGEFLHDLERFSRRLHDWVGELRRGERRRLPSATLLYEELAATEREFGGLEVDGAAVCVTTAAVVLEGMPLGPFRIRLDVDRVGRDAPFTVTALEPNPAASSDEITHPHVNGERLCVGEGRGAIAAALAEGRLTDFFLIVDRILHTYAEGAAYVELNRWRGVPCRDCADVMDADDAYGCRGCDESLCGDCLVGCADCGDGYCSGCIDRCAECEQSCCGRCLTACLRCRGRRCESCLEENVCTTCREDLEDAEQQAKEAFAVDAAAAEPPL